jgi:5-formyltetrahydrofolate cyclo-ligase
MDRKREFRKKAMQRLERVPIDKRYLYDKRINGELSEKISEYEAKSVMIYIPLSLEADITPLIRKLRRMGILVYVPFMVGESFILVKYRLPLRKKRFGIKEPKISKQYRRRKIDLAIVPILGMDATFRRVGFGRGMYDRFFEKEKKNIAKVIFVERILCLSSHVVTQRHDIKADIVITGDRTLERNHRTFRRSRYYI